MTFPDAVKSGLANYVVFQGRASRSAFWYWQLFVLIGGVVAITLDNILFAVSGGGIIDGLFSLAMFLPSFAVSVRRLHDVDRSGWWVFLMLLPVIGILVLLYWFVQPSQSEANQFGAPEYSAP